MWDKVLSFVLLSVLAYLIIKISSSKPNKYQFYFKFFIYYFLGSLISSVLWPFFLLRPKNVRNAAFGASILKHLTKLYGVKWELRNGDILAVDRGAVIVSNHQSSLDILGMFNIWHVIQKLTAIAKKELFYVWPFGLAAYLAGVVFVDRNNVKDAYQKLDTTSLVLTRDKSKIWLFPEGTRNKDYTKILPFKKGAFSVAVKAQVPVIPVVFSPYYFINRKKYIFDKGHVIIKCLDPVPTEGLTMEDIPELVTKVHGMMEAAYKDLYKEILDLLPTDYPFTAVG